MLQYRYGFSAVCTVFCTEHRGLVLPSVQTTARIQSNTTESVTCRSRTVGRAAKMQTQNEIDDLTMQIKDPSRVRGSGYIQFPPQRPFATPVIVQPPTICQSSHVRSSVPRTQSSVARAPQVVTPRCVSTEVHESTGTGVESVISSEPGLAAPIISNQPADLKLSRSQSKRLRKKKRDNS